MNISKYALLFGNSFIKHPKKGLINMKNSDNKCFLSCHVRHLNLIDKSSERISKKDKTIADTFDYSRTNFPVSENDYCGIEKQNSICINVFSYDSGVIYPIYMSSRTFSDSMDLLLIFEENKSHYVYIKDFDRLMFNKAKNKNKKDFCRYRLQCFSNEGILTEHKEICLIINGQQHVKLSEGSISFKNYSRQIPVPFKIYAILSVF